MNEARRGLAKDEWADRLHRSLYRDRLLWDIYWVDLADNLIASAALLEPEIRKVWDSYCARAGAKDQSSVPLVPDYYTGVYFMLLAYAVENLLKAFLVRNNRWKYERDLDAADRRREKLKAEGRNSQNSSDLPAELKGHDLVKFARMVGLRFDLTDEDLLVRLTRSATWFGRYPVPLRYEGSSGGTQFSDGKRYSDSHFYGDDIDSLKRFIGRLRTELNLPTRRRDIPPSETRDVGLRK